ncbi:MAG TPA: mannose-1-phosphate guanylyltransferase/mannose-6-phosphate isomerase [Acidimicrobiia bacterium]|nr:mannose-1-phosphate guanylyltransferase/mannose-6-phosphate isomerase [Acidimicrobiia bacterium]
MGSVITPVILSGGSGTRLWPLSLPTRPKQLQRLLGPETMIQATVRRAQLHEGSTAPIVVCNETQVALVVEQLTAIGSAPELVIVEPQGRNTAPAIAAAAMVLDPEVVMAVLPADHVIGDADAFGAALATAVEAAEEGLIVTFGVVPTRPETGFGYIEAAASEGGVAQVRRFVEKPDAETAERYLASGFLWNSGMFVFSAGSILEELRQWEPELVDVVSRAVAAASGENDEPVIRLGVDFRAASSISIDHAVMERTSRAHVVALDAGWVDVGSWQSLWEVVATDGETVAVGPVMTRDVERSYIRAESRPVAVIGVDDVVVIETADAVLVVDRRHAQDVRTAADWFERLRDQVGD